MKKTFARFALLALLLTAIALCTGCEQKTDAQTTAAQTTAAKDGTETIPVVLDQNEYLLYQNVFLNDLGTKLEGQSVSKRGVYTSIYDAYSGKTRYYVWGYLDNTQCCDWQWEFVPKDVDALPARGSLVRVRGTFVSDDNALDGYWIKNASVESESAYIGALQEIDMLSMSDTLERVQAYNIMAFPEVFEGKTFSAYGRMASLDAIEDPYYDGSWQIPFRSEAEAPSIGTSVALTGVIADGALADCVFTVVE